MLSDYDYYSMNMMRFCGGGVGNGWIGGAALLKVILDGGGMMLLLVTKG